MRIGTLTFHLGPNHGGYLQAYCLHAYLKSLGHEVEIINYKNPQHHHNETFRPWIYRRPLKLYQAWLKHRSFERAFKELELSPFTTDVREVNWNRYDAVVIGSDVVWDYSWDWLGHDPVYFGHFGGDYRGRIISYAPSTGTVDPVDPTPQWAVDGLKAMHGISARDETTAEIVKRETGRDAPLVLDPTWLEIAYREPVAHKKKQLVVYAFHITSEFRDAIVRYARKHGLKIIALGYYQPWADQNLLSLGPLDWEEVLRESEAMVAGTFHGTLYAIRTQCRFVTVLNDRILSRVTRALTLCGLSHRGISDPSDFGTIMDSDIVYHRVMNLLQPYVEFSREYLTRELEAATPQP
jgi:hypothetical protein